VNVKGAGRSRVTMREVAAEAGVSIATASRALAESGRVNPEMAQRVLLASEKLGYRANRVARALRQQVSQVVGLVVPDLTNPFFPKVVQEIEGRLRREGLGLILADARDEVAEEAELVRELLDHGVDGLLISVCDRIASRHTVRMATTQVPTVQVDRLAVASQHFVGVDQRDAIAQVVQHLHDTGRSRLAFVGSSPKISAAAERIEAFRELTGAPAKLIEIGDFSVAWGRDAARRFLTHRPVPEAIVCANDLTAVGALQALHEAGLRVPEDVAVTGFDDTLIASISSPPLTTVRQPVQELGRIAAATLRATIADPGIAVRSVRLPAEIVVRGSTSAR